MRPRTPTERAQGVHIEPPRHDPHDDLRESVSVEVPVREVGDVPVRRPALPDPDEGPVLPAEPVDPAVVEQRRRQPGDDPARLLEGRKDVLVDQDFGPRSWQRQGDHPPGDPGHGLVTWLLAARAACREVFEGNRGAPQGIAAGPQALPAGRPHVQPVVIGEGHDVRVRTPGEPDQSEPVDADAPWQAQAHTVPEPLAVPHQTSDLRLEGLDLPGVLLEEPILASHANHPQIPADRVVEYPEATARPTPAPARARRCAPRPAGPRRRAGPGRDPSTGATSTDRIRPPTRKPAPFHRNRVAALQRPVSGQVLLVRHDQLGPPVAVEVAERERADRPLERVLALELGGLLPGEARREARGRQRRAEGHERLARLPGDPRRSRGRGSVPSRTSREVSTATPPSRRAISRGVAARAPRPGPSDRGPAGDRPTGTVRSCRGARRSGPRAGAGSGRRFRRRPERRWSAGRRPAAVRP